MLALEQTVVGWLCLSFIRHFGSTLSYHPTSHQSVSGDVLVDDGCGIIKLEAQYEQYVVVFSQA